MARKQITKDYAVQMIDSTGRKVTLCINGDSVNEMVRDGYSVEDAKQSQEDNAFQNAIARGEIGKDAYIA
jgi:hypothetical protein